MEIYSWLLNIPVDLSELLSEARTDGEATYIALLCYQNIDGKVLEEP